MASDSSGHPCANCGKRPGMQLWGDALAVTHGYAVKWCRLCVLDAQIEHAEDRAARLPVLRAERVEFIAQEASRAQS